MYAFFHPDGKSLLYSARDIGINRCEFRWREGQPAANAAVEVDTPTTVGRQRQSTIQSIDPKTGRWVVALDRDPIYIVRADAWDHGDPEASRTIASGQRMTTIALSPDGLWAASTTVPPTDVRLWNAQTGNFERLLGVPKAGLIRFSPDGRWLITRNGAEFRLWSVGTWKKGPGWPVEKTSHALARISFSADGSILAVPQTTVRFQLLETRGYTELASLSAPADISDAVWSHDGRHFYMLSVTRRLWEWDLPGLRSELAKVGVGWEEVQR